MKVAALLLCLLVAPAVSAQTLLQDTVTFERAEVVEVVSEQKGTIPGTETPATYQTLRMKLLEGSRAGDTITVDNDYLVLKVGESAYLRHMIDAVSGRESYVVSEPYRIPSLLLLAALFLICLFVFGGKQGARGLLALAASLFFIMYMLLPGILAGYSPVLIATGVASLIIVAGSYLTHGFNRTTSAAVVGMLATILVTGVLAYTSIYGTRLSGYSTEETVALNFSTAGGIDFVGLLLGSLLIGLLGVLYDAAISQAIAIEELVRAAAHYSRRELFTRGMRIGREHIGALVNTLAIAYVGVSLPLLLLLTTIEGQSFLVTLNQELFATELVRMMVGSIGIILAVPITTAIAVFMLHGRPIGGKQHSHSQ
jgi:uncharacterized membrane protein